MNIYYQDKDIIVCDKPYGVSSQKSDKENMIDILSEMTKCDVYPIHRLDATTCGIMVYALNKDSASKLSTQVSDRLFKKEYLAIVHGKTPEYGEMNDFLYHDRIKNKSFVSKAKRAGTKDAKLEFQTLGSTFLENNELSLVKIILHTGRTHQIRVQFSSRSFFLYGDGKYGAHDNDKIALYSHSVEFFHPKTKEKLKFSSIPCGNVWELFPNFIQK